MFWFLGGAFNSLSLWYKPTTVTSFSRTRHPPTEDAINLAKCSAVGRFPERRGLLSELRKDLLLGFVPMPAAEPCSAYHLPRLPRIRPQAWLGSATHTCTTYLYCIVDSRVMKVESKVDIHLVCRFTFIYLRFSIHIIHIFQSSAILAKIRMACSTSDRHSGHL